jgi:hypothetical protein
MALSHSANNSSVLVLTYNFVLPNLATYNKMGIIIVSPFVGAAWLQIVKSALLPFSLLPWFWSFDFLSQAWLL